MTSDGYAAKLTGTRRAWAAHNNDGHGRARPSLNAGEGERDASDHLDRYAFVSHTDTWDVLSPVNCSRVHPLQRSRSVMPAMRAIRSSSDGQT